MTKSTELRQLGNYITVDELNDEVSFSTPLSVYDGTFTTGSTPKITLGDSFTTWEVPYGDKATLGAYHGFNVKVGANKTTALTVDSSSNVNVISKLGVGATAPLGSLDVRGNAYLVRPTTINAGYGGAVMVLGETTSEVGMTGGIGFTEAITGGNFNNVSMGIYYDGKANKMHFTSSGQSTNDPGEALTLANKWMSITRDTGLVGISEAFPSEKLHVGGFALATSGFKVGSTSAWKIRPNSANAELAFEYSTSNTLSDDNIKHIMKSDRMGINTRFPSATLTVEGGVNSITAFSTASTDQPGMLAANASTFSAATTLMYAKIYNPGITTTSFGKTLGGYGIVATQGTDSPGLILGTFDAKPLTLGTNSISRMEISSGGLVGIGGAPSSGLTVAAGVLDYNSSTKGIHMGMHVGAYAGIEMVSDTGKSGWIDFKEPDGSDYSERIRAGLGTLGIAAGGSSTNTVEVDKTAVSIKPYKHLIQYSPNDNPDYARRRIVKYYSAGSSGVDSPVMRIKRSWWGSGNFEIIVRGTYYSGSDDSNFQLEGHSSIQYTGTMIPTLMYGDTSSRLYLTARQSGSPADANTGYQDLYIVVPAYMQYLVEIIVTHSSFCEDDAQLANTSNGFRLF